MYLGWTKHLSDPAERERFEQYVRSCKPVLDRVKSIIEERLEDVERKELSEVQFETPNWENLQAYRNGFKSAMHILHKFVNLDSQRLVLMDKEDK